MSSWTLRCSFSMSFLAKDLLHLSQRWLFTPGKNKKKDFWASNHRNRRKQDEMEGDKTEGEAHKPPKPQANKGVGGRADGPNPMVLWSAPVWDGGSRTKDPPVWMILCLSRLPILLKIRPQISHGWMYLRHNGTKGVSHGERSPNGYFEILTGLTSARRGRAAAPCG